MFVLANLVLAIAQLLNAVLIFFYWVILIRALLSWVNPDPFNPIVQFLYRTTEPILEPIRRRLPMAGIDFSPIIAFLLIMFLRQFLIASLMEIGYRMRGFSS